jgi:hypothetical protein
LDQVSVVTEDLDHSVMTGLLVGSPEDVLADLEVVDVRHKVRIGRSPTRIADSASVGRRVVSRRVADVRRWVRI